MIQENLMFRTYPDFKDLYMPFDPLLFFGENENSDLYAYAITANGIIQKSDVFIWDHETDGREWYAGWLHQYLEKRLSDPDGTDE
jgi:hypothetical protein